MNDTEASVNRMEERLKLWDAKLDVLMARAEAADAQAKIEHLKCIDDIKQKRTEAQAQIDEFKAAGGEKWGGLKARINALSNDIEAAFKKLVGLT